MSARRRPPPWPDSPAWSSATRLWVLSALAVGLAVAWWQIRGLTLVVSYAVVLAYLFDPLIALGQRRLRLPRAASTLLVYGLIGTLVVLAPALLAPTMAGGVERLSDVLVGDVVLDALRALPNEVGLLGRTADLEPIYDALRTELAAVNLQSALGWLTGPDAMTRLLGAATGFVTSLGWLFLLLVVSIYLAVDGKRFLRWARTQVPPGYHDVYETMIAEVNSVWRAFFRGQLLLALVVGLMTYAGLVVLGLPYALPLALVAGVLEVVPQIGPVLSLVPAAAVALVMPLGLLDVAAPWRVLIVAVLYVVIQQVEGNLLVPRILGRRVNLPPVVVLLGVLAGARMGGVAGILLAAPVMGSGRVIGGWIVYQLTRPARPAAEDSPVAQHGDAPAAAPAQHDEGTSADAPAGQPSAPSNAPSSPAQDSRGAAQDAAARGEEPAADAQAPQT